MTLTLGQAWQGLQRCWFRRSHSDNPGEACFGAHTPMLVLGVGMFRRSHSDRMFQATKRGPLSQGQCTDTAACRSSLWANVPLHTSSLKRMQALKTTSKNAFDNPLEFILPQSTEVAKGPLPVALHCPAKLLSKDCLDISAVRQGQIALALQRLEVARRKQMVASGQYVREKQHDSQISCILSFGKGRATAARQKGKGPEFLAGLHDKQFIVRFSAHSGPFLASPTVGV